MPSNLATFGLGSIGGAIPPGTGGTPVVVGQGNANPWIDPGPWGYVILNGNFVLPGVVHDITGFEAEHEWVVQKSTFTSGGVTIWRGQKVSEDNTVVLRANTSGAFDRLYALRNLLVPAPGKKPPAFDITNPAINFVGITRVSLKKIGRPTWNKSAGTWQQEVGLIEFRPPKPVPVGPAAPEEKPDAIDQQIIDLTKQLAA